MPAKVLPRRAFLLGGGMFRRLFIVCVFFLLSGSVFGQDFRDFQWLKLEPVKNYNHSNPIVADVERYMPEGHIYRDGDIVTWAHETTHGLNAKCRNMHPGHDAFYTLEGYYVIFKKPRGVRKSDCIPYIDDKYKRIVIYNTYISGQGEWDDTPLYILDEWVAYTHGSMVGTRRDTVNFMLHFNFYVAAILQAITQKNPNYEQLPELRSFVLWNLQRTFMIAKTPEELQLVREFYAKYFPAYRCPY